MFRSLALILTGIFICYASQDTFSDFNSTAFKSKAVTYDLEGGRFGDRLLNYLHAKWISYKYNMPLLYKPFIYSDQLVLHHLEEKYSDAKLSEFEQILKPTYGMDVNYSEDKSILYVMPYFPENLWEHTPEQQWYYLKVDWEDPGFKKILREMVSPLYALPRLNFPRDCLTVAVHVRKGGGYDTDHTNWVAPLKLPPDSYYINQIKRMINLFPKQPLFIHIFTDDQNPQAIVDYYKSHFEKAKGIHWSCRRHGNHHDSNVVDDFFEMMRFDCLIRPDSNYSIIPSKVVNFKVVISPLNFKRTEDSVCVDEVEVVFNKEINGVLTKEIIHVLD